MNNKALSSYRYVRDEIVAMLSVDNLFTIAEAEPTRASYARALLEIGERNPMVVVLDADVSKSIGTNKFAEKFPERSFNFGIAEQDMFAAANVAGILLGYPVWEKTDISTFLEGAPPRAIPSLVNAEEVGIPAYTG